VSAFGRFQIIPPSVEPLSIEVPEAGSVGPVQPLGTYVSGGTYASGGR
jgi:hypothetical protein